MRKLFGCFCCVMVGCFVSAGCEQRKSLVTTANFQQKFDEIEKSSREMPGQLGPDDVEAVLGQGYDVRPGDPGFADLPPGVVTGNLRWRQWNCQNETLLVGYANDRVTSVIRLRR